MDKMDIAKSLIFKGLNINRKETLVDRIMIQEKVYLLQQLGIDLGYQYNWYLKGPYSPTLTEYIYDNHDLLNSIETGGISLNKKVIDKIEGVNSLTIDKPKGIDEASWYELLASILYIYNENHMWYIDKEKEEIIRILQMEKPKYAALQCEAAYDKLIEYNYIKVS